MGKDAIFPKTIKAWKKTHQLSQFCKDHMNPVVGKQFQTSLLLTHLPANNPSFGDADTLLFLGRQKMGLMMQKYALMKCNQCRKKEEDTNQS